MPVWAEVGLKALALAASTWFWLWYLVYENEQRAKEARRKMAKLPGHEDYNAKPDPNAVEPAKKKAKKKATKKKK